ncbi:MAG TPA: aminotransferase class IV [Bacteroidales bacterium]|nr:aminotransferase class IV [Bacteroidales bacterium]
MALFSEELSGDYFIRDFELRPGSEFTDNFLHKGRNLYEVVRVEDRVPLFLPDHLDRLNNSLQKAGLPSDFSPPKISESLTNLIGAEGIEKGNIKVVFHYGEKMGTSFFTAYFVAHSYPPQKKYRKGVKTITLWEDRPDPEIKNWRPDFRRRIRNMKASKNVYEVILISEKGFITEGSQSNVFIVRGNTVLTAPAKNVLAGITRKYVLDICRHEHLAIEERDFSYEELTMADAVFLTGTSPKVLPVSRVDQVRFKTGNKLVRTIVSRYDDMIDEYIKLHPYES